MVFNCVRDFLDASTISRLIEIVTDSTTTSTQRTGLSAFLDEQFNEAFNESLIEQDLPNVRWGRIDYLNVTRLTTKWAVWK